MIVTDQGQFYPYAPNTEVGIKTNQGQLWHIVWAVADVSISVDIDDSGRGVDSVIATMTGKVIQLNDSGQGADSIVDVFIRKFITLEDSGAALAEQIAVLVLTELEDDGTGTDSFVSISIHIPDPDVEISDLWDRGYGTDAINFISVIFTIEDSGAASEILRRSQWLPHKGTFRKEGGATGSFRKEGGATGTFRKEGGATGGVKP